LLAGCVSSPLPPGCQIHLINPWLLGEECTPIIIYDVHKALHSVFPERLAGLTKVKQGLFRRLYGGPALIQNFTFFDLFQYPPIPQPYQQTLL